MKWRVPATHGILAAFIQRTPSESEPVQLGTHTEQYKKALMRNNIGGEELLCMNEELLVKCGAAQPPGCNVSYCGAPRSVRRHCGPHTCC